MLNMLTKGYFNISLLFMLKHAAISFILLTVNKPCYNDSLCLHECTKKIGLKRKRHFLGWKSWNDSYFPAELTFQESVSKQEFYACARAKKSDVAATCRLHSVLCKITLIVLVAVSKVFSFNLFTFLFIFCFFCRPFIQ